MDGGTRKQVSSVCLRGRPLPRSLELLWDADRDQIAELFGITRVLTDLDVLDDGYGEAIMKESEDDAASVRAHRTVFEELGFFAELDGSELLALRRVGELERLVGHGDYRVSGRRAPCRTRITKSTSPRGS
jgi:hypothetical protein